MKDKECRNGLISAAAVFGVCFVVNWLAMPLYFAPLFAQTADVWRPEPEIMSRMGWCIARGIIVALFIAGAFRQWRATVPAGVTGTSTCNWRKSIKFGLFFGVLLGVTEAAFYTALPIPAALAIGWLVTHLICGFLWGIVLEALWRKLPRTVA